MQFEFATANRIVFGAGTRRQAAPAAAQLGNRALIVTGVSGDFVEALLEELAQVGVTATRFVVSGEPTTAVVQAGVAQARAAGCDLVIGLGGGSALDTGKAIAALLTNGGEPLDYLEVVGRGQPLTRPSAPLIALPTTAGTGAEVTRNAVLAVPERRVKVSLRSPGMLPTLAIVDPELTYSLPLDLTASTGLDALTQVLEPFVSSRANPLTDGICREGLRRAARSLRRACTNAADAEARSDMALTSLFGGLALANAGLGAVHGFAGVLGGMFPAPHGAVCACLLPYVMAVNLRALQAHAPQHPALARYDEVGQILTGASSAGAAEGVSWVQELCAALAMPRLRDFGVTRDDFAAIVAQAQQASSMKANPLPLTNEALTAVLEQAL
jgi:alcohol dehydrogenase class IV